MADSTSILSTLLLTQNQASKEVSANRLFNSASPSMLWSLNPLTTTGLTFGLIGGRYRSASVANQTVALTNNADNYVVALVGTGAVSVATTTTNWNSNAYIRLYKVTTASGAITAYEDHRVSLMQIPVRAIQVACSDESTAITVGNGKATFRMPFALTLSEVRASLTVAQASGSIFTVNVKRNGSTIFSTKITIDNTEKTSLTAATPPVLSTTALLDDDEITVDVDQIGASGAAGLKVSLIGY